MQQVWLNKNNNSRCILFFNGWGMDANAVCKLAAGHYDVCMFYGYDDMTLADETFETYTDIVLIAWSLGVWAATQVLPALGLRVHKAIALNGTQHPVHSTFGIPESIFSGTLNGWNETSRNKFNARMMGGNIALPQYAAFLPNRNVADQKNELQAIYQHQQLADVALLRWDVAVIGQTDAIFSPSNQHNWWAGKARIVTTEQPHFPFAGTESWAHIAAL